MMTRQLYFIHRLILFGFFSELDNADCLPVLKFLQSHGNVTTYEWRTGSKPVGIQEDFVVIDTKDEDDGIQETDDVSEIYITICLYQVDHRSREASFLTIKL